MKRYINSKSIPMLVILSTLLAVLLRIWTMSGGPDANSLFPRRPLPWVLLVVLTAATVGAIVYAVRKLQGLGSYQGNYPKSWIGGLASVPAAITFLVYGYIQLRDSVSLKLPGTTLVDTLTGIFGLVAGLCLVLNAMHRIMGRKPFFMINGMVCLYLALRLFNRCQLWSNEPQLGIVVFPFLASTALMLATYHRVCFDVDLGNRRWSALWTLMSVYFCVVAMLSGEQPLFYGLCALWKISDLCSMRPVKRKIQPNAGAEQQPPEAEV